MKCFEQRLTYSELGLRKTGWRLDWKDKVQVGDQCGSVTCSRPVLGWGIGALLRKWLWFLFGTEEERKEMKVALGTILKSAAEGWIALSLKVECSVGQSEFKDIAEDIPVGSSWCP